MPDQIVCTKRNSPTIESANDHLLHNEKMVLKIKNLILRMEKKWGHHYIF